MGSLQAVAKPQTGGMVHMSPSFGQSQTAIQTQMPVASSSQMKIFSRNSASGPPQMIITGASVVHKTPSVVSSLSASASQMVGMDRKQLSGQLKPQIPVHFSTSLVSRVPTGSTSYPISVSCPPMSGTERGTTVRLLPRPDKSSDSRAMAAAGVTDQPQGDCYLCGVRVSINLLNFVSAIPSVSEVSKLSCYSFLQKLSSAAGSARRDVLGRLQVCIDCRANLTVLERVQSIKSGDGISDSVLNDVACYRCGSSPGKDRLSYISCRLTKPEIPYFPSLWNAPRAQGSRPVDKNGRLVVCFHCRDECYVKFFDYRRRNVNVEARNYLPTFSCYVCGVSCPGETMHWIPSLPTEATGHRDCYPFVLNLKAVRGAATMDHNGCALVCSPCKELLYTQFLTMEQARVPLRFRSYMVNGRVFQPPADIPVSQGNSYICPLIYTVITSSCNYVELLFIF